MGASFQQAYENPAWCALRKRHAGVILGFLAAQFPDVGRQRLKESVLVAALESWLAGLRASGKIEDEFTARRAQEYIKEWRDEELLYSAYGDRPDEPEYDITAATENAIRFASSLDNRRTLGTESRLKNIVDLLEDLMQIAAETPEERLAILTKRRLEIDYEIERISVGGSIRAEAREIRERFYAIVSLVTAIVSDFRSLEELFRGLSAETRARFIGWEGARGAALDHVFSGQDLLKDSDEGRSFSAFMGIIHDTGERERVDNLVEAVTSLSELADVKERVELRRLVSSLTGGALRVQGEKRRLARELRRFIDDQVRGEGKRIKELAHETERLALQLKDHWPSGAFDLLEITEPKIAMRTVAGRSLSRMQQAMTVDSEIVQGEAPAGDPLANFGGDEVDRSELEAEIRRCLAGRRTLSLREFVEGFPRELGLGELVAITAIAGSAPWGVVDDQETVIVPFVTAQNRTRLIQMPEITFFDTGGIL